MGKGIVEFIIEQVLDMLLGMARSVFTYSSTLTNMASVQSLDNEVVSFILDVFGYIGFALFGVGLLISIFEYLEAHLEGEIPNIGVLVLNTIKSFSWILFIRPVVYYLYVAFYVILGRIMSGMGIVSSENINFNLFSDSILLSSIFITYLSVSCCIAIFKNVFDTLKRTGYVVVHVCIGYFYVIDIQRGNTQNAGAWGRQAIGLFLQTFFQTTILMLGMCIISMQPGNASAFLIGAGFMSASKTIGNIVGYFVSASSSKGNFGGQIASIAQVGGQALQIGLAFAK
jgi:hypothetical protein